MSTEIIHSSPPKRFHLDWVPDIFFHPRQAFSIITGRTDNTWLTPLIVLTITALILVLASGWIEKQAASSGIPQLPPDFEYYTPEQQAQFMQAVDARQGVVFLYVIPGIAAVAGLWLGWLVIGGLLHLLLTMLGGRGDTGSALNIVAWASLPLGLRDLVRVFYSLSTQKLIQSPGLSGFINPMQGNASLFLASFLTLIDIYLIWFLLLTALGTKSATHLTVSKALAAAAISIFAILLLQALVIFGVASLNSLTVIRPFF